MSNEAKHECKVTDQMKADLNAVIDKIIDQLKASGFKPPLDVDEVEKLTAFRTLADLPPTAENLLLKRMAAEYACEVAELAEEADVSRRLILSLGAIIKTIGSPVANELLDETIKRAEKFLRKKLGLGEEPAPKREPGIVVVPKGGVPEC